MAHDDQRLLLGLADTAVHNLYNQLDTRDAARLSAVCRYLRLHSCSNKLDPFTHVRADIPENELDKLDSFMTLLSRKADAVKKLRLHVGGATLDPNALQNMPNMPNLEALDLSDNAWLLPAHLDILGPKLPSVVDLNVQCSGLGRSGPWGDVLVDEFYGAVDRAWGHRLVRFNWRYGPNAADQDRTSGMLERLLSHLTNLEFLLLPTMAPRVSGQIMADVVTRNCETLIVFAVIGIRTSFAAPFFNGLSTCSKLTALSLYLEPPLNDTPDRIVCGSLPPLDRLKILHLAVVGIRDPEAWKTMWKSFKPRRLNLMRYQASTTDWDELLRDQLPTLDELVLSPSCSAQQCLHALDAFQGISRLNSLIICVHLTLADMERVLRRLPSLKVLRIMALPFDQHNFGPRDRRGVRQLTLDHPDCSVFVNGLSLRNMLLFAHSRINILS